MRAAIFVILLAMASAATAGNRKFLSSLTASGPDPEHAAEMTLYDPLIGDWDADVLDYDSDGTVTKNKGEWHFDWVLEGRAIQDVWIVPPRSSRKLPLADRTANNRYGTSIRVYDPATRAWNVTWINPVTGSFNRLAGRVEGGNIVQEGHDGDGAIIRWTFSDITSSSFHWRGEVSADGGKTWRLGAEFFGHRQRAGK
jgi:hypothetical protein